MSCSAEVRRKYIANTTDDSVVKAMWNAYEAQKRNRKRAMSCKTSTGRLNNSRKAYIERVSLQCYQHSLI